MAEFKGREELINSLHRAVRFEDRKGIEAELKVGDLLSEYLPQDTYIIAQPEIGEMQPDFLVISPKFGFRLIEVKNIQIKHVQDILSNGVLKTRYRNINPLNQVKSHVDAFNNYLAANYPNIGLGDQFKNIGYCVIHLGFTKKNFEYKFDNQIRNWPSKDKRAYFKYHLFVDQIESDISIAIERASKFGIKEIYLTKRIQKEILEGIKVSQRVENEYLDRFIEQEDKIASVNAEIQQIKESVQIYQSKSSRDAYGTGIQEQKQKKYKLKLLLSSFIGVLLVSSYLYINKSYMGDVKGLSNSEKVSGEKNDYIEFQAEVIRFYYDSKSGTKFLTLTDGDTELEGVIFNGTKAPFIEEGTTYQFGGYMQSAKNITGKELRIIRIKK